MPPQTLSLRRAFLRRGWWTGVVISSALSSALRLHRRLLFVFGFVWDISLPLSLLSKRTSAGSVTTGIPGRDRRRNVPLPFFCNRRIFFFFFLPIFRKLGVWMHE